MTSFFSLVQPAVRVSFGAGALDRVPEEVDVLGGQRAMIVAAGSADAAASRLRDQLDQRCVDLAIGARQHVPAVDAAAATLTARRTAADCIVAIGGGSAIGLAKAVSLATNAPIVAVPTTYSGSEMTSIYGITEARAKKTGRDEGVRPRAVVYDPELTLSLPPRASAASGMNALAHCVEALYAPDRSPVSTLLGSHGARCLLEALPAVVSEPGDVDERSKAFLGALYAGWCLGITTMGLHHRICHVLGGIYAVDHGEANAVMLPYVVAFNADEARPELSPLAELVDGGLARSLRSLVAALGLPTTLEESAVPRGEIGSAARLALRSPVPNPRAIDEGGVEEILLAAYDGRLPE
jgi:maleylacetate reductase